MSEVILAVNDVTKSYGDNKALKGMSLELKSGEILGLLGPNGAGKSTLINCICGLLKPDSGNLKMFDLDLKDDRQLIEARAKMGVVPQEIALVEELSAYENCMYIGGLYGLKGGELKDSVEEALNFVDLWDRRKDRPGKYSGGMKRRLNIACGLVHKPTLLLMDEPTVGVDPQSRNYILESVRQLNDEGTTVIYSSHYMEEVEALCDHIVIMDLGETVAEGTFSSLIAEVNDTETINISLAKPIDDTKVLAEIDSIPGVTNVENNGTELSVISERGNNNFNEIIAKLGEFKQDFTSIDLARVSLEDVFLDKTGKKLRD
ncbi:MAG: ABC transporter ATP-binding protein [Clostridiaceae bacterium]|mgnify:CR=1 FL=1|nr:ABC transporter ATP-binding protein [Clostridiaceae bacterium]